MLNGVAQLCRTTECRGLAVLLVGILTGMMLPRIDWHSGAHVVQGSGTWRGGLSSRDINEAYSHPTWLESAVLGAQWAPVVSWDGIESMGLLPLDGNAENCVPGALHGRLLHVASRLLETAGAGEVLATRGRRPWGEDPALDASTIGGLSEVRGICLFVGGVGRAVASGLGSKELEDAVYERLVAALRPKLGPAGNALMFGENTCLGAPALHLGATQIANAVRQMLIASEVAVPRILGGEYGAEAAVYHVAKGLELKNKCPSSGNWLRKVQLGSTAFPKFPLQGMAQSLVRTCHRTTPWRCLRPIPRIAPGVMEDVYPLLNWLSHTPNADHNYIAPANQLDRPFLFFLHVPKTGGTTINVQLPLLFPSFAGCNTIRDIPFNGQKPKADQLTQDVLRNGASDCDVFSHETNWNHTIQENMGRISGTDHLTDPEIAQWLRSAKLNPVPPRPVLVLTHNRDPVQRVVSFLRHHLRELSPSTSLEEAIHRKSFFHRALRSQLQTYSDDPSQLSLLAMDRILGSFWMGVTEYSDLSLCLLAFQTHHPAWKSVFCSCDRGLPLELNQNEKEEMISIASLKEIFDRTSRERLGHHHLTTALWERAEALHAAHPDIDIECLAQLHQPYDQ